MFTYLDFDDKLIYRKNLNSIDKFKYKEIKNVVHNIINKIKYSKNDVKGCKVDINNNTINKTIDNIKNKSQFKINKLSNPVNPVTNSNYNEKNISKKKKNLKLNALSNKNKAEIYSQNIDISLMKEKPPKLPDLFLHDYNFNEKVIVKPNETFGKLNQETIPIPFYNHLMISEENKNFVNKKLKYFRASATQRNKKKLLTIIYYSPKFL